MCTYTLDCVTTLFSFLPYSTVRRFDFNILFMSPELWHNQTHMTPLKAITISCLSLSLRSVTSTFNQQLLLSKSFSSTTNTMEQSILDAIGKISLSPIDKGALKDETKIDAGNQLLILTSSRVYQPKMPEPDLNVTTTQALSGPKDLFLFMSSEDLAALYVAKRH